MLNNDVNYALKSYKINELNLCKCMFSISLVILGTTILIINEPSLESRTLEM